MVTTLVLVFHDWKKEFHVHVDPSCIALGVVLTQLVTEYIDHSIAIASRMFSKEDKNYSNMECEGLVMLYALQKFKH